MVFVRYACPDITPSYPRTLVFQYRTMESCQRQNPISSTKPISFCNRRTGETAVRLRLSSASKMSSTTFSGAMPVGGEFRRAPVRSKFKHSQRMFPLFEAPKIFRLNELFLLSTRTIRISPLSFLFFVWSAQSESRGLIHAPLEIFAYREGQLLVQPRRLMSPMILAYAGRYQEYISFYHLPNILRLCLSSTPAVEIKTAIT